MPRNADHLKAWRDHVADFSKRNNVSYKDAMKSQKCKDEWKDAKNKQTKPKTKRQKKVKASDPVVNVNVGAVEGAGLLGDLYKKVIKPASKKMYKGVIKPVGKVLI